jgi:prepilin-type N-terminal cleavage/methylation domain-containing protein
MTRAARTGFTLIELLTAMAIFGVAVAAAMGVFIAQNTAYVRETGSREAQQQARSAVEALGKAVRMAGFGIDPQLAFDFDFYDCNLGSTAGSASQRASCGALQRDSIAQADELVLYYRNPQYSTGATAGTCAGSPTLIGNTWRVLGAAGGATPSVTLEMRGGDQILAGQIVQVLCQDASTYTYATAKTAVVAPGTTCSNQSVPFELPLTVTGATGALVSPWTRSDLLTSGCFSNGGARAFLVERQRYFIQQDAASGRPFLMLDRGVDIAGPGGTGPDGALDDNDLQPVAADIDDLQVSYVLDQVGILTTGAGLASSTGTYMLDVDANGIWGDTPGTAEQLTFNTAAAAPYNLAAAFAASNTAMARTSAPCDNVTLDPYRQPCVMDKAPLEVAGAAVDAYRWLPWTGNVTGVRISISARSATPAASGTALNNTDVTTLPALENRPLVDLVGAPGWYGAVNPTRYERVTLRGTVRAVNMSPYGMFTF